MMHICHLSLFPDAYCSVMLDLTDDQNYFAGTSRDQRLLVLWNSYREWAERSGNVFWCFVPIWSIEFVFSYLNYIVDLTLPYMYPCKVCQIGHQRSYSRKTFCYLGLENTRNLRKKSFQPQPAVTSFFGRALWFKILYGNGVTKPLSICCTKAGIIFQTCPKSFIPLSNCRGDVIPRYQAALLGSLAEMELLTLQHGRVMPHAVCENFKRSYLVYRSSLNWLATENLKLSKCRFHLRPKAHQLSHIVFDFLPLNPRRFSNYLDEDFIFKTKKVAEHVHPLHMPMHVCMRYSIAVCLRWSGGRCEWKKLKVTAKCFWGWQKKWTSMNKKLS